MSIMFDLDSEYTAWLQEDVDDMMGELVEESSEEELQAYYESQLCKGIPVDMFPLEDIDKLIEDGVLTEQDLIDFYGNDCWRDIP